MKQILLVFLIFILAACSTTPPEASPTATRTATFPTKTPILTPTPLPDRSEPPLHYRMVAPIPGAGYLYRAALQNTVGMAFGPDGRLYIADYQGSDVMAVSPDGTLQPLKTWRNPDLWQNGGPYNLAFGPDGSLYVSDQARIYRFDAQGNATALPGIQVTTIGGMTFSPAGELYYSERANTLMQQASAQLSSYAGRVYRWDPSGTSTLVAEGIEFAQDLVFGLDGTLYVSQMNLNSVVQVDVNSGQVSNFVANSNWQGDPTFLAVDSRGNIWARNLGILHCYAPDGSPKNYILDGITYHSSEHFADPGIYNLGTAGGLVFDAQGGLWVGAFHGKLFHLETVETTDQDVPSFTLKTIIPGFEGSTLAVDSKGNVYTENQNSYELLRFAPDGKMEVLLTDLPPGRVAVALDSSDVLFLGFSDGQIKRLEADGSLTFHALQQVEQMVFGRDGNLYAIAGGFRQPKSVVRIDPDGLITTIASELGGQPLGGGGADIFLAPEDDLYVFVEQTLDLFRIDYNGQGGLVANLVEMGNEPGPTAISAGPDGTVYYNPSHIFSLYRLDAAGVGTLLATDIRGDPWSLAVSPDGKWIYIVQTGAIDKIPVR